ncbi:unnamed protein product [Amoebophrya sp. A25]|nr:unnamed protein product [Amoebophrya sp. A25]|eukprot:GSA25T00014139001.1
MILGEFFHPDQHAVHRDRMEIVMVLTSQQYAPVSNATGEWLKDNMDFAYRVHVFRGYITSGYDYKRCGVPKASAVLVVPNVQNPVDKQKEDVDTLLRVQAVKKKSSPDLKLVVILHLMRNRYMFNGVVSAKNLLCADDFKYRMIGRVSFLPGLPSFLCSLLQASSTADQDRALFKKLEASFQEGSLMKNQFTLFTNEDMHFGQGKELYALPLSDAYRAFVTGGDRIRWIDIVRDVLYRSKNKDVMLLGYIRYNPESDGSYLKGERECILFPNDHYLPFDHEEYTKVLGIFIASDAFDVRQRPSMEVLLLPEIDSDMEDFDEAEFDRREAEKEEDGGSEDSLEGERAFYMDDFSFKSDTDRTDSVRPLTKAEKKAQHFQVLAGLSHPDLSKYRPHEKIRKEQAPPKVFYRRKVIEKQLAYLKQHKLQTDVIYEIGRKAFADRYLNNPRARSQLKSGENNLPFDFEGDHFLYCLCGPASVGLSLSILLQNLALGLDDDGPEYSEDDWNGGTKVYSKTESADAMDMRNLEQGINAPQQEEDDESAMSMATPKRKRLRKIILVVLSQKRPADWEDAMDLSRQNPSLIAVWVKGTPTKMLDLERCSFRRARVIFVQGYPTKPTDGECIFCTRLIESVIGSDASDPFVPIVIPEITLEANFRYIPLGLSPKVDHQLADDAVHSKRRSFMRSQESYTFTSNSLMQQPYIRSARYAAGRMYVSSMLTSLAVNQIFNPDLGTLIQILSDGIMLVDVPEEFYDRPYGKLWKFLLSQNLMGVGLLRRASTNAKTLGASTSLGLVEHEFPLTAPPKDDVVIEPGDRAYVIRPGLMYALDE